LFQQIKVSVQLAKSFLTTTEKQVMVKKAGIITALIMSPTILVYTRVTADEFSAPTAWATHIKTIVIILPKRASVN
jgi:hypothetical protein